MLYRSKKARSNFKKGNDNVIILNLSWWLFKITIFRLIRLMKKERPTDIWCSAKHDFAYVLPQLIMKSTNFSPFWRIRREKHWKISNWNSLILPPNLDMVVSKPHKIKLFLWVHLRKIKLKLHRFSLQYQISCQVEYGNIYCWNSN